MITLKANPAVRLVGAPCWGRQREGYAPGGPVDSFAAAVANRLAGNADDAPLLEIILSQGQLHTDAELCMAVSGAPLQWQCNSKPLPNNRSVLIPAGSELTWQGSGRGFRSYLAVQGGITAEAAAGQFATLPVREPAALQRQPWALLSQGLLKRQVIRVLPGPEASSETARYLTGQSWQLSRQSDAQGIRLQGAGAAPALAQMASAPVQDGTVQLTSAGPIVLMRDRQTVGGYPRIAQVIDGDINLLAQYRPGQRLRFETVTVAEAMALEQAWAERLQQACIPAGLE